MPVFLFSFYTSNSYTRRVCNASRASLLPFTTQQTTNGLQCPRIRQWAGRERGRDERKRGVNTNGPHYEDEGLETCQIVSRASFPTPSLPFNEHKELGTRQNTSRVLLPSSQPPSTSTRSSSFRPPLSTSMRGSRCVLTRLEPFSLPPAAFRLPLSSTTTRTGSPLWGGVSYSFKASTSAAQARDVFFDASRALVCSFFYMYLRSTNS